MFKSVIVFEIKPQQVCDSQTDKQPDRQIYISPPLAGDNKAKNSLRFIRQNVTTQSKQPKVAAPPCSILFNHMALMAETPHTSNKNGSKVNRKVCSI